MGTTPSFRSALAHRGLRRLLVAHALATLAQVCLTLAVGVAVLDGTGSGVWVSVSVAAGFAPYVAFSGLAGVLADQHSRSAVLAWSCGTRAVVGAALVAALVAGWSTAWTVPLAALTAVLATPAYPSLLAAAPQLVSARDLPPANAAVTGVENAAWIAGPGLLGVVLLGGLGPAGAVTVATVLFAVAGAGAVTVPLPRPTDRPSSAPGLLAELAEGMRVVSTVARVRTGMAVAVVDNFLYGYVVVAVVLLAADSAGGQRSLGWLNGALSVGAVGALVVAARAASTARPARALALLMAGFGAAVAALPVAAGVAMAATLLAVAGVCTTVAEVVAVTVIQAAAPGRATGRVFGVYDQLNVGAIAVGSAVAGPLALALGPAGALTAVGLGAGTAAVLAARRLDRPQPVPAPIPRVPRPRLPLPTAAHQPTS